MFSQCLEKLSNRIGTVAIFADLNFRAFFRASTKFTNFLDTVGGISAMMMTLSRKVILLPYKWPEKKGPFENEMTLFERRQKKKL